MNSTEYAVRAEGLRKRYGDKVPVVITAVFLPLAVRRFQRLSQ